MSKGPPKTVDDMLLLPDDLRVELIEGEIVERAATVPRHGLSQLALGSALIRRFGRGPGGRWPGGWWILTEADVSYGTPNYFTHDLAGWRRERMSDVPDSRPIRLRPDWVCEIVSPSNAKNDLVTKPRILAAAGVPYYWVAYPSDHVLLVHQLVNERYELVLTAGTGETIRAEPFSEVELRVATLFGEPDDE
ncbi:MAG TPA: Uma2 family endonuclease [Kofleriaceae bacterium]